MTKNHNYTTPAKGAQDWHKPLNENFRNLDVDIEIRDVQANLTNYAPKDSAKFFATDTEHVFVSDGDSWTRLQSSGLDPKFSSVRARDINGEAYAKEFAGDGLASKVENALAWLQTNMSGHGTVRVTPKDDGTPWIWDKDLVVEPITENGFRLTIDYGVPIEYPGNGVALTLDTDWSAKQSLLEYKCRIEGGAWEATGDPTGCIRLEDTYNTTVEGCWFEGWKNGDREAFAVQLRNVDGWSESNRIRDCKGLGQDIFVDCEPAPYNGGSGTTSFHGTEIQGNRVEVNNIGVRARGGFDYCSIAYNSFFSKGDEGDAWHIQLGGADDSLEPHIDGTTIERNKFEDPGGPIANDSDDAAFRLAPNYFEFKQPTLMNNKIFLSDTNTGSGRGVLNDAGAARLLQMRISENGIIFENLVSDVKQKIFYDGLEEGFGATFLRTGATSEGSSSEPSIKIGGNGAGFYVNETGKIVAVDEGGDTTIIT
ncbi:hypothetical protein [Salinigranum salinum]|uniref:hypothetical protein n=1 Tax=Salinigranum salinum TaxID=1364937 RepID=UPI0012609486|nr:hypothetical protein [Salinigranum salinum]